MVHQNVNGYFYYSDYDIKSMRRRLYRKEYDALYEKLAIKYHTNRTLRKNNNVPDSIDLGGVYIETWHCEYLLKQVRNYRERHNLRFIKYQDTKLMWYLRTQSSDNIYNYADVPCTGKDLLVNAQG